MNRAIPVWAMLTAVQSAPAAIGPIDLPSPWGGTFPGERIALAGLWAGLAIWLCEHDERRRIDLAGLALLAATAGLLTSPMARAVHQPMMWIVQLAVAGQLWAWAGHERTRAAAMVASIQALAAFVVFPLAQGLYGLEVRPGGAASALYEVAGPLAALSLPVLGSIALHLALRHDGRAQG